MANPRVGLLHYSSPPVIGGVEIIIQAHAQLFAQQGYPVRILTGQGEVFDERIEVCLLPEISSLGELNEELDKGIVSKNFEISREKIYRKLKQQMETLDLLIIHNCLTMHFNLPLTAALIKLIQKEASTKRFIAWCHDATWINPYYQDKKRDLYPWHITAQAVKGVKYVTISRLRQGELGRLFGIKPEEISIIPNGVDPQGFLNLSPHAIPIFDKFDLFNQDLVLFYPTRILRRKNIELAIRITSHINNQGKSAKLIITSPPDPHNKDSLVYYHSLKDLIRELGISEKIIFLCDYFSQIQSADSTDFHGLKSTNQSADYADSRRLKSANQSADYADSRRLKSANQSGGVDLNLLRSLYLLSDLLLFPTLSEGFGIPILEAGMCGLPVVCSRIEPLTEVGGADVLYLDMEKSPHELAREIIDWLDRHLTLPLFKKVFKHYTWQSIFTNLIEPLIK